MPLNFKLAKVRIRAIENLPPEKQAAIWAAISPQMQAFQRRYDNWWVIAACVIAFGATIATIHLCGGGVVVWCLGGVIFAVFFFSACVACLWLYVVCLNAFLKSEAKKHLND
jgi:hypothetical protein